MARHDGIHRHPLAPDLVSQVKGERHDRGLASLVGHFRSERTEAKPTPARRYRQHAAADHVHDAAALLLQHGPHEPANRLKHPECVDLEHGFPVAVLGV